MTVLITLTVAGADSGPYNLYSNLDGYTSAFETGVSKSALLAGYPSALVPDYTTIIRIVSTGDCTNYIDIPLTSTTTTTTTSIPVSTFCYDGIWELDDPAHPGGGSVTYINSSGIETTMNNIWLDNPVSIEALSIVSTVGVIPITCESTTTTTTSSPVIACVEYTVSTTSASNQNYDYYDCFGVFVPDNSVGGVGGYYANTFCAQEGSVDLIGIDLTLILNGPCPT